MKNKAAYIFSFLLLLLLVFVLSLGKLYNPVLSATNHVVISEVQIAGDTDADDEFVELYNPTDSSVDMTGWRVTRKTSSGTQSNLVASMSGTIAAHGFFLIAHPDYDGAIAEDATYSATSSAIAANNTVLLYSDAGITVVDKIGMGTATDNETQTTKVPTANSSIERKATESSTAITMAAGGGEETAGNGQDTNNNNADFVVQTISNPQNASSTSETPASTPSPTDGPTTTPTPSPTDDPTPTNTPTSTPTATPSPTSIPTSTPTNTPTTVPTATSTPTPTLNPSSSPTPTSGPTTTPTPTITPTPIQIIIGVPGRQRVCTFTYKQIQTPFFSFFIPRVSCTQL